MTLDEIRAMMDEVDGEEEDETL